MVAPKEDALSCEECHRKGGRLEGVPGFYLPGRDHARGLDAAGIGLVLLTLAAVGVHGFIRFTSARH
jgi:hypothetical protein